MEVFMDEFLVFGNSSETCLSHLDKMLKRCKDTNLCLNWEKSHFMIKEGIVLGHKISKNEIEVDKAKVDVIAKLPHPTTIKGVRSFIGHADFYRRFIQDFSKIARPMTRLLDKDTPFIFSKECAVLGKRKTKYFQPMHYARKTMTDAQAHYTTTEKELLAVMEKSRNVMKCLKMPSKFARSSMYGASISWGHSRLHEGTSNGYQQKDKNEAKTDKIEHGMEKRGKVKVNQKVNQVKVKDEADIKEMLNGPTLKFLIMATFFILDKLTEVSGSDCLQDKMKIVFTQTDSEDGCFIRIVGDLCFVLRSLSYLREMVGRDSEMLGVLEQLLARTEVGRHLKAGYADDMYEPE
nr:reverse transcriptase domain-containing protein [Tanacetum cinerariifolium]